MINSAMKNELVTPTYALPAGEQPISPFANTALKSATKVTTSRKEIRAQSSFMFATVEEIDIVTKFVHTMQQKSLFQNKDSSYAWIALSMTGLKGLKNFERIFLMNIGRVPYYCLCFLHHVVFLDAVCHVETSATSVTMCVKFLSRSKLFATAGRLLTRLNRQENAKRVAEFILLCLLFVTPICET
eukprot:m.164951 g.164951  ORF g.164951 m.164951 type:complete len:186 (+) comp38887_c0_seq2:1815-2372(+)